MTDDDVIDDCDGATDDDTNDDCDGATGDDDNNDDDHDDTTGRLPSSGRVRRLRDKR